MSDLTEAVKAYREMKVWGQSQAQVADQARRDMKEAQDAALAAERACVAAVADAQVLAVRLADAEGRIVELGVECGSWAERAAEFEDKAGRLDVIVSVLTAPAVLDLDGDDD